MTLASLNQELAHLTSFFQQNGYPCYPICKTLCTTPISTNMVRPEPKATVFIPFVKGVSERIKRICTKRGIWVYFRSTLELLAPSLSNIRPKRDPHDTKGRCDVLPCLDCGWLGRLGFHQPACTKAMLKGCQYNSTWLAYSSFQLMHITSRTCCSSQARNGSQKETKIITPPTTSPPGFVLARKHQCTMVITAV